MLTAITMTQTVSSVILVRRECIRTSPFSDKWIRAGGRRQESGCRFRTNVFSKSDAWSGLEK